MRFSTVFFDLDDTLYPASSGLWPALKTRMSDYMRVQMGFPADEIPSLRERYYREYGTTLRGLEANHSIDVQDFLAYVHDVPLKDYLRPDPAQREAIRALKARRLIFTNADAPHARRVLAALGLEDLFEAIVDINAMTPWCKPMPEAFALAMRAAGETDPSRCVLIDDLPHNLQAARAQGLYTVLYGADAPSAQADAAFLDWRTLPGLLDR